jgi:hypothetical protein
MSKISKGCKKTHLNNTEPAVAVADPELARAEAAEGVAVGEEGSALVAHHALVHHVLLPPLVVVALAFLAGNIATILLVF